MKTTNITGLALAALMLTPAYSADDSKIGDILEGINMFTPADDAPAYKIRANEKYGTQWAVDMAYSYWSAHHQPPMEALNRAHYALLHAQLNQRLVEDSRNGGTWLRVELSGSWGLDSKTASSERDIFNTATTAQAHADAMFGPHDAVIPELAIMHYFAGKRACVIAGMVNLTNYFDAVSIANDSFSGFANTGFVNSTILPMPDSNAGAVLQVELSRDSYAMVGASRTGATAGYNPFTNGPDGYCVVGEFGHMFNDGEVTVRLNPFYKHIDSEECGGEKSHRVLGLTGSVEYTPSDRVTLFARAGLASRSCLGNSAELSCGANVKVIPSRENDFLGVAYGVFKGSTPGGDEATHNRESVLELMYSLQINDYMKLVPHLQFIHDPTYRVGHGDEILGGVQAVLSF